jgi:hypothetical protein
MWYYCKIRNPGRAGISKVKIGFASEKGEREEEGQKLN